MPVRTFWMLLAAVVAASAITVTIAALALPRDVLPALLPLAAFAALAMRAVAGRRRG